MKIFQILNGICHWDATKAFPTLESTKGRFAPDIFFVEAPDQVHEGWGFLDGEFIRPEAPEGWLYDEGTGTFYPENPIEPDPDPLTPEETVYAELAAAYTEGVKNA